jgi:hypothetical protein
MVEPGRGSVRNSTRHHAKRCTSASRKAAERKTSRSVPNPSQSSLNSVQKASAVSGSDAKVRGDVKRAAENHRNERAR